MKLKTVLGDYLFEEHYLVIKVTGKAFDEGSGLLKKYISIFRELLERYRLAIVAGGGGVARRYIELFKEVGISSNYWLDLAGIWASRLNALLLLAGLAPYAYPKPATSLEEAVEALGSFRAVTLGGLIPGQSTASVLLEVAEALGVKRVYYYSAAGRVYSKDPTRYKDAVPLSIITASELKSLLKQENLPGEYALIDAKALDIATRSGIEIQVLPYKDPESLIRALSGENPGTIIVPE